MRTWILVLSAALCVSSVLIKVTQAQAPQATPSAITEVEALKYENLALRAANLEQQLKLIEAQWREVKELLVKLNAERAAAEAEIIKRAGIPDGQIDWQARMVIPKAKPTGTKQPEGAAKK